MKLGRDAQTDSERHPTSTPKTKAAVSESIQVENPIRDGEIREEGDFQAVLPVAGTKP